MVTMLVLLINDILWMILVNGKSTMVICCILLSLLSLLIYNYHIVHGNQSRQNGNLLMVIYYLNIIVLTVPDYIL